MNEKELIERLKEIRKEKNISQDAVGAHFQSHPSQISKYERLMYRPRVDVLCQWADSLGYEVVLKPKD